MRRSHLFVSSLALVTLVAAAAAQDKPADAPPGDGQPPQRGPGGPSGPDGAGGPGGRGERGGQGMRRQLDPEKAKAAWAAQAGYVARSLSLDEGQANTLAMVYADAREAHGAEAAKLREELAQQARENDDPDFDQRAAFEEAQKKMTDLDKTHREKFAAGVSDALGADKSAKAVAVLGTFDPGWDGMVDVLNGFRLELPKLDKGFAATSSYTIASAKAREFDDREAMRTAMQEARETLNDTMKTILTEEQLQQFQRTLGGGRRGMGGGGGGQGGGDNRRGGGQGGQPGGPDGNRPPGGGNDQPAPPPPPPGV